jgi:hypothetical protein
MKGKYLAGLIKNSREKGFRVTDSVKKAEQVFEKIFHEIYNACVLHQQCLLSFPFLKAKQTRRAEDSASRNLQSVLI